MPEYSPAVELQIGAQGRILLPAALRRHWHVETGQRLIARLEGDRLVLEKPAQIVRRLKERFAKVNHQSSTVDELIAERRLAARQEEIG